MYVTAVVSHGCPGARLNICIHPFIHSPIHSFILQILVNARLLASRSVCLPLVEGNNKQRE